TASTTTQSKLCRTGAVVDTDSDLESMQLSKEEEERLLRSPKPGTSSPRRDVPKRSSEGMKAKARYKAALEIQSRLRSKAALSLKEKEKLAWAEQRIEEGRLHYAKLPHMASTGGFANRVEEVLASKRQRSAESASRGAPASKRPKQAAPTPSAKKPLKKELKVSEVIKRHLIVALIDRSDENGKMSEARWKTVHTRLVESLFMRMEDDSMAPMPTFDGAGWLNGVKILKCMDDQTRMWLTQTVSHMEAPWEGAQLDVVGRDLIPSIPKAKVLFPIAIQGDRALKLLQRQNPDIPTADWKHLFCKCPALTRSRVRHLGAPSLASLEDASKRKPGELLAFAKATSILKDFETR
ncbi:hypothetical protein KR054_010140, partial [Drosophila jambulina]